MKRLLSLPRREWMVRILAGLTVLMGLVNLVSATLPAFADRLARMEDVFPLEVRHGSHLAAAISGFALILLGNNLRRRKRVAWLLTLLVLVISAISHMLKGLDYEEASLSILLALALVYLWPEFHARSDEPSVRYGLGVMAASVVFTLLYGMIGFYLLDRHFSMNFDVFPAIRQTIVMFTQFTDPGLVPMTHFGKFFADSIYTVGLSTFGISLLLVVRPVLVRHPASPEERQKAKAIVEQYGHSALAPMTLFDDKTYFFTPGGTMIAYTVKGRIALVLGSPIGPQENIQAAIDSFLAYCAKNDWQASFYQVTDEYLEHYKQAGLEALRIGQEAVVHLDEFTLEGKIGKDLRTIVNRMKRLEYTSELYQPPHPESLLYELRLISDEWLSMMKSDEMRFATGWFDETYLNQYPLMTVNKPDGQISAFANILPEYQKSEVTIDLMRRRQQIENGVMDYLFITMLQWAQSQGYQTFSLGLSALSGIGEHSDDPLVEKSLHYIYENVNRFYNFKGLHAFKEKFRPEWQPRYLIYPGLANLAAVATALARANSGDSFMSKFGRKN